MVEYVSFLTEIGGHDRSSAFETKFERTIDTQQPLSALLSLEPLALAHVCWCMNRNRRVGA